MIISRVTFIIDRDKFGTPCLHLDLLEATLNKAGLVVKLVENPQSVSSEYVLHISESNELKNKVGPV